MLNTTVPNTKRKTRVSWALALIVSHLIFNRKKLPDSVEMLDTSLTYNCTREQRNRWVKFINTIVHPRWFRRMIENRLNKGLPTHERIFLALDREYSHSKIFRYDSRKRQRWSNWYGNHFSEPKKCFVAGGGDFENFGRLKGSREKVDFKGLVELVGIVKQAESKGRQVKAMGSGHALTPLAQSDEYLVCTHNLNLTQRLAKEAIKPEYLDGFEQSVHYNNTTSVEKWYLFETSGGTKLHHLIEELNNHCGGLALINQGGSSVQSITGAISTSTHGSGMEIGPFPAFVKSITVVGKGGKIFRIEPKNGITDPQAFQLWKEDQMESLVNAVDEYEKEWKFEMDECGDESERTQLANAQRLQIEDLDICLVQNDEAFRAAQVGIGAMGVVFSLIIAVQPLYYLYEERKIFDWELVKKEMEAWDLRAYANRHRHFEVLINPYETKNEAGETIPRKCLVTTRNYAEKEIMEREIKGKHERNYLSSLISGISISGRLSPWVFNRGSQNIPNMINNSLQRIEDHKEKGGGYLDLANLVLDQGLGELKFYGYAIEFGFPLDKVIVAVEKILEVCQDSAEYDHYLAAPFALRFVKHCPAHLSMMQQGNVCMIELVSVMGVTGTISLMKKLEKEMLKLGGVPHWGLSLLPWNGKKVRKAFPMFDKWKVQQAKYAGNTFLNPFLEELMDYDLKAANS
ncbi:D-arabinono-1,4-lactone oxidase [Pleomorphovibrio marinus]|uniref:D-arabinono-1,4-lactone oxidase n=1 Tax=Pleomorphovibrio marinus TaxID=2164132 RepID=UPI000E0BAFE8|nr:D-arabinono-1,4-lactone oxidase [Pleomorphovibrio marinus]